MWPKCFRLKTGKCESNLSNSTNTNSSGGGGNRAQYSVKQIKWNICSTFADNGSCVGWAKTARLKKGLLLLLLEGVSERRQYQMAREIDSWCVCSMICACVLT